METPQTPLEKLFDAFPTARNITDRTVAVYDEALADIPEDRLRRIVDRSIREHRFLPSIAEIRTIWAEESHAPAYLDEQRRPVGGSSRIGFIVRADGWQPLYLHDRELDGEREANHE